MLVVLFIKIDAIARSWDRLFLPQTWLAFDRHAEGGGLEGRRIVFVAR